MASAPAKVASAGRISSNGLQRTKPIASSEATRANMARRRAQMASREAGSEGMYRRAIDLSHEAEQTMPACAVHTVASKVVMRWLPGGHRGDGMPTLLHRAGRMRGFRNQ